MKTLLALIVLIGITSAIKEKPKNNTNAIASSKDLSEEEMHGADSLEHLEKKIHNRRTRVKYSKLKYIKNKRLGKHRKSGKCSRFEIIESEKHITRSVCLKECLDGGKKRRTCRKLCKCRPKHIN